MVRRETGVPDLPARGGGRSCCLDQCSRFCIVDHRKEDDAELCRRGAARHFVAHVIGHGGAIVRPAHRRPRAFGAAGAMRVEGVPVVGVLADHVTGPICSQDAGETMARRWGRAGVQHVVEEDRRRIFVAMGRAKETVAFVHNFRTLQKPRVPNFLTNCAVLNKWFF